MLLAILTPVKEHIVRVVDVQEDLPLLIMEYAPLGNLLQQEGFSLPETTAMLEQQLKAVKYLHEIGITHRDIKPENILVELRYPELKTKLSDFGLSSDESRLKTFCGTELYAAPEVSKNGTQYTNAVDIWSLGVVALQMAHGLPKPLRKWDAQDWTDEVHHHARKQSGRFATLLHRMLVLLPSARPSAEKCLTGMSSWILPLCPTPPQATQPKRNIKVPRMREGEKCIQEAKEHSSELAQVRVRAYPGKPLDLFGAISSSDDTTTKVGISLLTNLRDRLRKGDGDATREKQNLEDRQVPNELESSDDADENTDEENTEIFDLNTGDVEAADEMKASRSTKASRHCSARNSARNSTR